MVTRQTFKDMAVQDDVYATSVEPLVIVTRLHFLHLGREVGYATLYGDGMLWCHELYLPLAIEWITNNYKHRTWFWKNRANKT